MSSWLSAASPRLCSHCSLLPHSRFVYDIPLLSSPSFPLPPLDLLPPLLDPFLSISPSLPLSDPLPLTLSLLSSTLVVYRSKTTPCPLPNASSAAWSLYSPLVLDSHYPPPPSSPSLLYSYLTLSTHPTPLAGLPACLSSCISLC
jgi:hypothetical protein